MPNLRESLDELNSEIAEKMFPETYEFVESPACTYYTLSLLSPQTDTRKLTEPQFYNFKKSLLTVCLLLH